MVALFAVVSGAFGLLATNADQRSARNYEAARGAADTLVARVALDLRSQSTVSNSVIDAAFGAAEALIDRILTAVAAKGSLSPHDIGESIARMRANNKEQLAALDRSRGALLYEFAETSPDQELARQGARDGRAEPCDAASASCGRTRVGGHARRNRGIGDATGRSRPVGAGGCAGSKQRAAAGLFPLSASASDRRWRCWSSCLPSAWTSPA